MDLIKVVCGIIKDGNNIFVCRRKEGKFLSGYWEFPGGKVGFGESEKDALQRELIEELEMKVVINELLGSSVHDYGKFQIILLGYYCSLEYYSDKLVDHDAYEWIAPEKLLSIKLAPADIPLAKMINNI